MVCFGAAAQSGLALDKQITGLPKVTCPYNTVTFTIDYNQDIAPSQINYYTDLPGAVPTVTFPASSSTADDIHTVTVSFHQGGSFKLYAQEINGSGQFQSPAITVSSLVSMDEISSPISTRCQGGGTTSLSVGVYNNSTAVSWSVTGSGNSISTSGVVTWGASFQGTATITASSTGACSSSVSKTKNIVVYPSFSSGTISHNGGEYCANSTVSLTSTANASGGNGGISYLWQYKTSPASSYQNTSGPGSDQPSYTVPVGQIPAGSTYYYRRLAHDLTCNPSWSASNELTVTVGANLTAGTLNNLSAICSGTSPGVFSGAAPTGGGGTYYYTWQKSNDGVNWSSNIGATGASYDPPENITSKTWYRRTVTSNCGFGPLSTSAYVDVYTTTAGTISIGNSDICYNTGGSFSITGNSGAVTWQKCTAGCSTTTDSGWSTAASSFSNLTTNTQFRAKLNDGSCGVRYSNAITVTVSQPFSPGSVSHGGGTYCANSTIQLTSTANGAGGKGTISYQWQNKTSAGGTYQNINLAGADQPSYTIPVGQIPAGNTYYYRRLAHDVTCNPSWSASNELTIVVGASLVAGTLNYMPNICTGTSPGLISGATPTGGGGGYTYTWQKSNDGVNWSANLGITTASYDPPETITSKTWYRRNVYSSCGYGPLSSDMSVDVYSTSAGSIGGGSSVTVCAGSNKTFTISGNSGPVTWQLCTSGCGNESNWSNNPGSGSTYNNITQTTYVRATINDSSCGVKNTSQVTINVYPALTAGSIPTDTRNICLGENTNLISNVDASGGDGNITYRWRYNSGSGYQTLVTNDSASMHNVFNLISNVTAGTTYTFQRQVKSGCQSSFTNSGGTVTVNIAGTLTGGSISAIDPICDTGQPVSISISSTGPAVGGGGNYHYSWYASNVANPDVNNPAHWSSTPIADGVSSLSSFSVSSDTWFKRTVTSECGGAEKYSNVVKADFRLLEAGSIDQPSMNYICTGDNITLTVSGAVYEPTDASFFWQICSGGSCPTNTDVNWTTNLTGVFENITVDSKVRVRYNSIACGIAYSDEVQIIAKPRPLAPDASDVFTYCEYAALPAFAVTTTTDPGATVFHQWYHSGQPLGSSVTTSESSGVYTSSFKPDAGFFSNPVDSATFEVRAILNGCEGPGTTVTAAIYIPDTLSLSIDSAPYSAPISICPGQSLAMELAGGNDTPVWKDPDNITIATGTPYSFSFVPTKSGAYTVSNVHNTACFNFPLSTTFEVNIVELEEVTFIVEESCGEDVLSKHPDRTNWYWQTENLGVATTNNSPTITVPQNQTIYLRSLVSNCWGPQLSYTGTGLPLAATPVVSDVYRFAQGPVTFSANGGQECVWYAAADTTILQEGGSKFTIDVTAATTQFLVKSLSGDGCPGTTFVTIAAYVYDLPLVTQTGPQYLEVNETATLQLSTSNYPAIAWYKDGSAISGQTSSSLTVSESGRYKTEIELPDGQTAESVVVSFFKWNNRPDAGNNSLPPIPNLTPATVSSTPEMNYVRSFVPRDSIKDAGSIKFTSSPDSVSIVTTYLDGLGRAVQTVAKGASPLYNDMITVTAYDSLGRVVREYLPYAEQGVTSGGYRMNALAEQYNFYKNPTTVGTVTETVPFGSIRYDNSPLNEVLEKAAPGRAWYPGGTDAGEDFSLAGRHTQQSNLRSNTMLLDDSIKVLSVQGVGASAVYRVTGAYTEGALLVSETFDENGTRSVGYKDKLGRNVLSRTYDANRALDTYYAYDDMGQLRLVLPPQVSKLDSISGVFPFSNVINSGDYEIVTENHDVSSYQGKSILIQQGAQLTLKPGFSFKAENGQKFTAGFITSQALDSEVITDMVYFYEYDERGRMIAKKVPGAAWVYMVYDKWDRLVLTQDGNLRSKNEWLFTKYDTLNRPVITGIKVLSDSVEAVRASAMASTVRSVDKGSGGGYTYGYKIGAAYPPGVAEADLRTVAYYDTYAYLSDTVAFDTNLDAVTERLDTVRGLPTGGRTRVLNPEGTESQWLLSATYYEYRYRPIQNISTNLEGGVDKQAMFYDFSGNVINTVSKHQRTLTDNVRTIVKAMDYDHANRLKTVTHKLDTGSAVLLAKADYNELGQLMAKNLHSTDNGATFKQSIDYRYNARGWLTSINDPELEGNDYFGMELHYNSGFDVLQFNGNIAGVTWRNVLDERKQAFGFLYDDMQRIKMADYVANNIGWTHDATGYQVKLRGYDDNGNILALERNGLTAQNGITFENTFGMIDNLAYNYFGNKLTKVTDSGDAARGFKNTIDVENEYSYDANGNLDRDLNKDIKSIRYNYLNLPDTIEWNNGNKIVNTYTAAGAKLKQKTMEDTVTRKKFYHGQFLYQDSVLHTIFTDEGRIVNYLATENSQPAGPWMPDYQYHLKDHLGNTRTTFSALRGNDEIVYLATMETYNAQKEANEDMFDNLGTRHQDMLHNHTDSTAASYAAYLYGDTTLVGPAKVLKVNKGDTVRIEVFAQFVDMPGNETIVNPFLLGNAIAGAFSGTFGLTEGGGPLLTALGNYAGALGVLGNDSPDGVPNATLNYMFFGENFEFDSAMYNGYDFDVMTSGAAANNWEMLTLEKVANRKGYLFIYVANESPGDKVYFDDLKITHIEHPVVQYDDYNLGGDTFNSYVSGVANKYLYQNKELISELDLDIFDFEWRGLDRKLMRTWQIDPMAEKFYSQSPYSWALNNPLRFIDPDGRTAKENLERHREDMGGRAERFANRSVGLTGIDTEKINYTSSSDKSGDKTKNDSSNGDSDGKSTEQSEDQPNGEIEQGGNLYEEQTLNFNFFQKAFLPVEGIGVAGSFTAKGSYRIVSNPDGTWSVHIGASGKTSASLAGDVTFTGSVNLVVNGVAGKSQSLVVPNNLVYETGMTPIGLSSFTLPHSGNVSLQLNISYIFRGPEGAAVPMPGLSRTLNIPFYNPGYLSPK
tara:strand:+ start:49956 stop:58724 length:8769 start_codon:yes stop_codon:yes gene_type:complete